MRLGSLCEKVTPVMACVLPMDPEIRVHEAPPFTERYSLSSMAAANTF